ncbi:MAG: hypothetical protein HY070_08945 [Chloroflexi bacterium]|nr:hypothetical protein [Chloroflexota bacterium]
MQKDLLLRVFLKNLIVTRSGILQKDFVSTPEARCLNGALVEMARLSRNSARSIARDAIRFGTRGVMASGDGVEQIFATCGFNTYTHEDIYRLNFWPVGLRKQNILRHQRLRDGWNLLRLYAQLTPRAVQLAEGMLSAEGQGGKIGDWWDQSRGVGYILEAEGELAGAVRVQRGAAAYWLRFWLHPQAQAYSETLLQGAFALLWAAPHKPIYCSVRDYESGLPASLAAYGFQHLQTRALLVKHLSARVKAPVFKLMPALEKRPEPAASVPHHAAQK